MRVNIAPNLFGDCNVALFFLSLKHDQPALDDGKRSLVEGVATRPRLKKHKCAILLGYSGTGYLGMQRNPNARTIEGDLYQGVWRQHLPVVINSCKRSFCQCWHRVPRSTHRPRQHEFPENRPHR